MLVRGLVAEGVSLGRSLGLLVCLFVAGDPLVCGDPADRDVVVSAENLGAGLHGCDGEALAWADGARPHSIDSGSGIHKDCTCGCSPVVGQKCEVPGRWRTPPCRRPPCLNRGSNAGRPTPPGSATHTLLPPLRCLGATRLSRLCPCPSTRWPSPPRRRSCWGSGGRHPTPVPRRSLLVAAWPPP